MNIARKLFSTLFAAALAAAPALAQAPAAGLTRIGAAAAVKGAVKAQAPGAVGRVIDSGKTLYLNDHVTTDAAGRLQVLLLDETVFTIGPSSDMVLDEFVYDPNTSAGKVSASIVKGTFRFVTGKVARKDPDQMKVKLAVGTIGIRGSVAVGETGPNGSTVINGGAGGNNDGGESSAGIFVSNNGQTTSLTKPGSGATILPGAGPSGASDMGGKLNSIMGGLMAKPGSSGNQGGPGSGNAGDASGKDTAAGGALANNQSEANALATASALTTQNAAQDSASGMVQGDGFFFSGHAPITCSGAGCVGGGNPVGALQLYVDFTNRTYGGAGASDPLGTITGPSSIQGSFIHIHGITQPAQGDTIQQIIGSNNGINRIAFGTTVPGIITLQSGTNMDSQATGTNIGPGGLALGANFNGSTLNLQNSTSIPVQVNLTFTGNNSLGTPLNASGSFQAPYTKLH